MTSKKLKWLFPFPNPADACVSGLPSIANTCRRLYSIANKLLYSDIDVGLAPLNLLLRTVVENKELAAKVKRIKFSEIWTVGEYSN